MESVPPASNPRSRSAIVNWSLLNWVPIVLVFASLLMTGIVTVRHTQALSPLDEWVYYDYTVKIPSQGIVRQGETIGKQALEQMSCFGDAFGQRGDACGSSYNHPRTYPQEGKTTADIYTPIYFAVTWFVGEAIHTLTGLSFLTAARLSGFLWLSGGVLILYALLRRFKVGKLVTLGLGLAVIAAPSTVWSVTYISTDAPTLLVGGALLLLAMRAIDRKSGAWWLVPVAMVGVWLKITTIFGVGLVALILLVYALWRRRRGGMGELPSAERRRLILLAVATAAAAVIAEVIWLVVHHAIAIGPGPSQGLAGKFAWRDFGQLGTIFLTPGPLMSGGWSNIYHIPPFVAYPLQWLCIAGVVGAAFMASRSIATKSFAVATLISSVLFAPALFAAMSFVLGNVFPVIPRYGLALAPAFVVAAALIVRNRLATSLVLVYGAGTFVLLLGCAIAFR